MAYEYDHDLVPGVAMLDAKQGMPAADRPSWGWWRQALGVVAEVADNVFHRDLGEGPAVARSEDHAPMLSLAHLGIDGMMDLSDLSHDALPAEPPGTPVPHDSGVVDTVLGWGRDLTGLVFGGLSTSEQLIAHVISSHPDPGQLLGMLTGSMPHSRHGRPDQASDYDALFATLPLPTYASAWREDASFSALRVAGFNPIALHRVPTPELDLTGVPYPIHGDSLDQAVDDGRLYAVDYGAVRATTNGHFPAGPKTVHPARALFVLPPGDGPHVPMPLAIRLSPGHPVVHPGHADLWSQAKIHVNCADFNHHEMVAHLAGTHLLMEPFVVATKRHLDGHPVGRLLAPHQVGTLWINNTAVTGLIGDRGEVDKLMAPTIESSRALAVTALVNGPDFHDRFLPAALEARGVMDPNLYFPYRDDALAIWEAIHDLTTAYVDLHYADDASVAHDATLQVWGVELAAKDGGRVKGFGQDGAGAILTRAYLAEVLTMLIFTGSAQHASVNFPHRGILAFAPTAPGGCYRGGGTGMGEAHRNPLLDTLPPLEMAATQADFLSLLGGVYFTRLGQYPAGIFEGDEAALVASFASALDAIEAAIDAREAGAPVPYPYLKPSRIPASINI